MTFRSTLRVCPALFVTALLAAACSGQGTGVDERAQHASPDAFPEPTNSQSESEPFLTPEQALATIEAPDGFEVELFAAEPDVQQPVAMTTDSRGRLWVAENYTYADSQTNYDLSLRDRIVILSDSDGDGRADQRKVFWDQAQRLTSVAIGFGGVWALAPPHLLFIPDANGDDHPDGPPVVMLDGWDANRARHNFVNGLRWGPDGWLYGRNGITVTSSVGRPGTAEEDRTLMNCGIWRFHPVSHRFEVVCHGTTNPWGMDWDRHGELFFINTVIGHLWHAIPGAHFQRMFGEDFNPRLYELIPQTADHVHWDEGTEEWTAQRKGLSSGTDRAGGGHAHSGMLIYQGDNWPAKYRHKLYTLNLHGRRINCDSLHRQGATYVGRHEADMLQVGDPWFRGIELHSGPDGEVYLLDWSDIGECHENDGVHRTSGRIYRVRWKGASSGEPFTGDLAMFDSKALVKRLFHADVWHRRQARELLQQRYVAGEELAQALEPLHDLLKVETEAEQVLRAVWALHATDGLASSELLEMSHHPSEFVRSWVVRLLAERIEAVPDPQASERLVQLSRDESSGLVLTYLASALQRVPPAVRWEIAKGLLEHEAFADDPVLPRMIWYGIEPLVIPQPRQAAERLLASKMPKVTRFTMRSLVSAKESQRIALETVLPRAAKTSPAIQLAILRGMHEGLQGRQRVEPPEVWESFAAAMREGGDAAKKLVDELAVVFGDGRAAGVLLEMIGDAAQPLSVRRDAIETLADVRAEGLAQRLLPLLSQKEVGDAAIGALAKIGYAALPDVLLKQYSHLSADAKDAAIAALAQRKGWAARLLDAVDAGQVDATDLPATALRQIQLLGDPVLTQRVQATWASQQLLPADRLAIIHQLKDQLTTERLQEADRVEGRRQFKRLCANCHQLFDDGGAIGPALTGAQRDNAVYWLENIIAPSAAVAEDYRIQVVLLEDGRVLSGVVLSRTPTQFVLQTTEERVVLNPERIEEVRPTKSSLMPDGLLDPLDEKAVADLLAYLMSSQQVPLEQ